MSDPVVQRRIEGGTDEQERCFLRPATAPDDGFLTFRRSDDRLTLEHTEVAETLEGRGVGRALVRAALADAGSRVMLTAANRNLDEWHTITDARAALLDQSAPS